MGSKTRSGYAEIELFRKNELILENVFSEKEYETSKNSFDSKPL